MSESFKIESHDLTIADIFKDFYSVPDFQREYVWKPENVEKLLQDVHDEFYNEDGRLVDGPEYFLGTIVGCKENGIYQLIDGQQRMTTLYLVLCAARDTLLDMGMQPSQVLEGQLTSAHLDPKTGDDIKRHRLTLQYEDSDGILEKIVIKPVPIGSIKAKTDSVKNILNAYYTIASFYKENFDQKPDELKKFIAAFTNRIKLIRIVTPSITNALKVFETINDRGVGLNAMDLLKNLLFMKTTSAEYPKLKQKWKAIIDSLDESGEKPLRFLRYYIMANHPIDYHKSIREDEIYEWFINNTERCGIDKDPIGFCDELIECAKAYENFVVGKSADGKENRFLQNIMLLGGALRQQNILLIAARKLDAGQFDKLCCAIENLIFCYLITREPTKSFERNFAKWSSELRGVQTEQQLDDFLQKNFFKDMAERSSRFDLALRELNTNSMQQYRLKYVLAKLTQHIEENAWGSPKYAQLNGYTDKSVHIEHILPQSPETHVREMFDKPAQYNEYIVKLGNLTLLEKTINTSISNGAYDKKIPGYRQSSFLLTKSIAEKPQIGQNTSLNRAVQDLVSFETWDSASIEKRQQILGNLARKVWNMPEAA